jgi:uncharacterized protein YwqG
LPSARFQTRRAAACDLGQSRIGGLPDLPEGLTWPVFDGRRLAFIAQLNLADFAPLLPLGEIPAAGFLLFFYDERQQAWGFDPQDRGSSRVVFVPSGVALHPAPPSQEEEQRAFPLCIVSDIRATLTVPGYESPLIKSLGLSSDEDDQYFDGVLQPLSPPDGFHQFGGYAEPVQGDMQLECQLVTHGVYVGEPAGYKDPRRASLEPGAADWRLLLQVDSDDNAAMMWGDAGRLYYWIRKQDLASRRFAETWTILQCH